MAHPREPTDGSSFKNYRPSSQLVTLHGPWVVCGDFNITMDPGDRNTQGSDWRAPLHFSRLVSSLGLLNITLGGRRYTWTNDRDNSAMARLDRFLISNKWNTRFPNSTQKALSNTSSDHCTILYVATNNFNKMKFFRFENCWLRLPQLENIVTHNWATSPTADTPLRLHEKLQHLQKAIKTWAKEKVGNIKLQIITCRDFIGWTDRVKEARTMTEREANILISIKKRYIHLAVLEKDLWKQRSKTNWELNGDRGTNYKVLSCGCFG